MARQVGVKRITDEKGPDCNGCGSFATTHIVRIGPHEGWLCLSCSLKLYDELRERGF